MTASNASSYGVDATASRQQLSSSSVKRKRAAGSGGKDTDGTAEEATAAVGGNNVARKRVSMRTLPELFIMSRQKQQLIATESLVHVTSC